MSVSARDVIKGLACGENVSSPRRAGALDQAGLLSVDAQPMGGEHVFKAVKAGLGIAAHQPACTGTSDGYHRRDNSKQGSR